MYHLGVTRGRLLTEIGNRLNIDFLSATALHIRNTFIRSYQLNCHSRRGTPERTFSLVVNTADAVLLQMHNSSASEVILQSVQLSSSGVYRCEVSGEAPFFETVTEHGHMMVVGELLNRILNRKNIFQIIFFLHSLF